MFSFASVMFVSFEHLKCLFKMCANRDARSLCVPSSDPTLINKLHLSASWGHEQNWNHINHMIDVIFASAVFTHFVCSYRHNCICCMENGFSKNKKKKRVVPTLVTHTNWLMFVCVPAQAREQLTGAYSLCHTRWRVESLQQVTFRVTSVGT